MNVIQIDQVQSKLRKEAPSIYFERPEENLAIEVLEGLRDMARMPFKLELWLYAELIASLKSKSVGWIEGESIKTSIQQITFNAKELLLNRRLFEGAMGHFLLGKERALSWYQKGVSTSARKLNSFIEQLEANAPKLKRNEAALYRLAIIFKGKRVIRHIFQIFQYFIFLEEFCELKKSSFFSRRLLTILELKEYLLPFEDGKFASDLQIFSLKQTLNHMDALKIKIHTQSYFDRISQTDANYKPYGFNARVKVHLLIQNSPFPPLKSFSKYLTALFNNVDKELLNPETKLFHLGLKMMILKDNVINLKALKQITTFPTALTTHCKVNAFAVSTLLLGPKDILEGPDFEKISLKNFSILLDSSMKEIKNRNKFNLFFVYLDAFNLKKGKEHDYFGSHLFVIVQFVNNKKKPFYRVYNSYLDSEHPVGSKKGTKTCYYRKNFSVLKFKELFLSKFQTLFTKTSWDREFNSTYKSLFNNEHSEFMNFEFKKPLPLKYIKLTGNAKKSKNSEIENFEKSYPSCPIKLLSMDNYLKTTGTLAFKFHFESEH